MLFCFSTMFVYAGDNSTQWLKYENNPLDTVKAIMDHSVNDTVLNYVDADEGQFQSDAQLANTLDSARYKFDDYLELATVLGLITASILIIYNGLRLVLAPLSDDQVAAVSKRLMYLGIWVLLLTWFFFILKVLLSFLVDIAV